VCLWHDESYMTPKPTLELVQVSAKMDHDGALTPSCSSRHAATSPRAHQLCSVVQHHAIRSKQNATPITATQVALPATQAPMQQVANGLHAQTNTRSDMHSNLMMWLEKLHAHLQTVISAAVRSPSLLPK